ATAFSKRPRSAIGVVRQDSKAAAARARVVSIWSAGKSGGESKVSSVVGLVQGMVFLRAQHSGVGGGTEAAERGKCAAGMRFLVWGTPRSGPDLPRTDVQHG